MRCGKWQKKKKVFLIFSRDIISFFFLFIASFFRTGSYLSPCNYESIYLYYNSSCLCNPSLYVSFFFVLENFFQTVVPFPWWWCVHFFFLFLSTRWRVVVPCSWSRLDFKSTFFFEVESRFWSGREGGALGRFKRCVHRCHCFVFRSIQRNGTSSEVYCFCEVSFLHFTKIHFFKRDS